jgi:8-oxo-dGTP pyrophosphatase MutT (NUDIX family)
VRDRARRIYLHRRSDTKDWAPDHWDVAAGGVIVVGEDPLESAMRELEEELGITGQTLVGMGQRLYEDDTTRCVEYVFEVVWDGPIRHQPEEVAEGRWVTLAELADLLADPGFAFVPDTRALLAQLGADGVSDYASLAAGSA